MKKTIKNIFGFKAFSVLLSLSLLLGALWCVPAFAEDEGTAVNVWDGTAAAEFDGGDGTEANPYKISNGKQLFKMMNDMGKDASSNALYYELTNDVALSDATTAKNWVPNNSDGDAGYTFIGHFDGKGYNITGLYYNASYRTRVAFIPRMGANSSVKNVNIIGANINSQAANSYAAAITADLRGTGVVISNCFVDSESSFTATGKLGGIIVDASKVAPSVNNCGFAGTLKKSDGTVVTAGGIIGLAWGNNAKISNCYSVGTFPVFADNATNIQKYTCTNVYTNISAEDSNIKTDITEYTTVASLKTKVDGYAKVLSADEMTGANAKVNMTAFDFYTTWQAVENGYPVPRTTDCAEYTGEGTKENPYVISTDAQLYALVIDTETFGNYYELANDIALNFTDTEAWYNTASQWVTAANYDSVVFKGNFDGKGYTVSGLYVNANQNVLAAGLFPILGSGAVISNLTVKNSYLSGLNGTVDSFVGVIAGVVNKDKWDTTEKNNILAYPTILACGVNTATVNSLYSGGIIGGGAGYAKIESSYSANLTLLNDSSYSGTSIPAKNGIVGKSWNASTFFVKNCYTTYASPYITADKSVVASNVVPGVKVTENGTTAIPTGIMGGTFMAVENSVPVPSTAVNFIKVDTLNDEASLSAIRDYLLGGRINYIVDVNNDVTFDICDLVYAALGE